MKKLFYCITFYFAIVNTLYGQNLSLNDLLYLQKNNLSSDKEFLTNKNYKFSSSNEPAKSFFENNISYSWAGWSFSKDDEKVKGLLYLGMKDSLENVVIYQTSENNFNSLEKIAKSNSKNHNTLTDNNKIISSYRNKSIQINFIISAKEYSTREAYFITLENYVNTEQYLSKTKIDEEYNTQIENGNTSFNSNNLNEAKKYFQQALQIKPSENYPNEKISEIEDLIVKNEKYNSLIKVADMNFSSKQFRDAKELYEDALSVKPSENYPKTKIYEINKIITFLEDRKTKIYDYKETNRTDFDNYEFFVISEIKNQLRNETVDATVNIKIVINTDTSGKVIVRVENISATNQKFADKINSITNSKIPKAASLYEYFVSAKGELNINLQFENKEIKVKKYYDELKISNRYSNFSYEAKSLVSNTPNGYYKIGIHKKSINNSDFSNHKLNSYRTFGGMSSAILSVIIPGLGDAVVTGGKGSFMGSLTKRNVDFLNSPLATTLTVYGLIGVGAYYKMLSNQEYDKYLKATNPYDIEPYYKRANQYHHTAIIVAGTGVLLWTADIIWVAVKGHQNKKETRDFRKQFSFNYNPQFNSVSFGYSQKF